jgi:hypothetical protein
VRFEISQARLNPFEGRRETKGLAHCVIHDMTSIAGSLDATHAAAQFFANLLGLFVDPSDVVEGDTWPRRIG